MRINPFSPFRAENGGITIEDYSEGRITLLIEQPIDHVYGTKQGDPRCAPLMDGPLPDGCDVRRTDLGLPAKIRISLPIPSTGLDYSHEDAMRDPACG